MTEQTPEVVKIPRTRRKMDLDRKANHHKARELMEAHLATDSVAKNTWLGLFPGKQVRVVSNLLLDYVPGFVGFAVPFTAEQAATCLAVLQAAASDTKAYRKANKTV